MPRYSARASVCERATWAATSVTTVCFSLRLRLKSPSFRHASRPGGCGASVQRPVEQEPVPLRRDRHLRWPLSSSHELHQRSSMARAFRLPGRRGPPSLAAAVFLRRPANLDQAACADCALIDARSTRAPTPIDDDSATFL